MKKIIISFIASMMLSSANSQVLISLLLGDVLNSDKIEFGLDGGANFANISNLDPGRSVAYFNLGFYFDITLKNHLLLHTGVIVKSNQGANKLAPYSLGDPDLDDLFSGGSVKRQINTFSVPILMKYRFATLFHVEAGPMLALRTRGYDDFTNTVYEKEDLTFRNEISDNYKRIDAGIMIGTGMKISKVPKSTQIGVRYYYGLVDPLVGNTGKSQNFSSLYIYCSIPIGVSSEAKKDTK